MLRGILPLGGAVAEVRGAGISDKGNRLARPGDRVYPAFAFTREDEGGTRLAVDPQARHELPPPPAPPQAPPTCRAPPRTPSHQSAGRRPPASHHRSMSRARGWEFVRGWPWARRTTAFPCCHHRASGRWSGGRIDAPATEGLAGTVHAVSG